ncbi:hypothetical protein ACFYMO_30720 [Streptomyces sp. NPDC007025]|uniref:hypothetical protein n=1 Tax=Streptomyces sp. NPDC007025 TaxID=3364771 RepID=UPI0036AC2F40
MSSKLGRGLRGMTPRGLVLGILGAVTFGVAVLSMYVSYQILNPRFGAWASPTVGALDTLWVVFQLTEILSGNNRRRARRVQVAGLALTLVNAAIPTAELIRSGGGGFDLAVVLTPIAIVVTKTAWWITLPSLGRPISPGTRQTLLAKRREVADRLEEMEAEASHRIELLQLAARLDGKVARAEADYRKSVLETQKSTTEELHKTAEAADKTLAEKTLPSAVGAIRLPELGTWTPGTPQLTTGTPDTAHGAGRESGDTQASGTSGAGQRAADTEATRARRAERLAELASVAGVPTPRPGIELSNEQLLVVMRHMRHSEDPPLSYRKAEPACRAQGFVGSAERMRRAWAQVKEEERAAVGDEGQDGDQSEEEESEDEEQEPHRP